jgi:uncharacterized protein YggL (DUF469 family)
MWKGAIMSQTTTVEQIDEVLLQFIAETHHRLNELNGHGTAREQACQALLDIIAAARVEELKTMQTNWLKLGDPECGIAIDNRIAELEGGGK